MDAKKKTILAACLILLWVGLAVWQWRLLQEPVHVPLTNVTGHPSVTQRVEAERASLRVNLDLRASTALQRQATFTVPRNIFAVPRPDGTFAAGDVSTSVNPPASNSTEISTQYENTLESEQYRYLGFLRVDARRRKDTDIAVLKRDGEVLVLRIGDRVDDHLILKAINSESVTIRNVGTHRDQTVSLSEESSAESSEEPTGQE
ncbi:MAG: hypothetical protein OJF51_003821 [Nitrospira sp.]|jgi:hypothetical protein|nr:MAG: hypothetical protein OJF51_003821 [Nitrospira sp.]